MNYSVPLVPAVPAAYREQLPCYADNPYLAALPDILDRDTAARHLTSIPQIDPHHRDLARHQRHHLLLNLSQRVLQPLSIHLDLQRNLDLLLRTGLASRNPARPEHIAAIRAASEMGDYPVTLASPDCTAPDASGMAVIGVSGMGKTVGLKKALSLYPQVIRHTRWKDAPFIRTQISWMVLQCPSDASIKSVCVDFFGHLSAIVGFDYSRLYAVSRSSTSALMQNMAYVAALHGLGILAIDEIQNIRSSKGSGDNSSLMSFFVRIMNQLHVPIVFVGTPECRHVFNEQFRMARRASSIGDIHWDIMQNDAEFLLLCQSLWPLQYTRHSGQLDHQMVDTLHKCSCGITSLLVTLFCLAQILAMADGTETLSPGHVVAASDRCLNLIADRLRELNAGTRRGDLAALNREISALTVVNLLPKLLDAAAPLNGDSGTGATSPMRLKRHPTIKGRSSCALVRILDEAATAKTDTERALAEAGFVREIGSELIQQTG